MNTSVWPSLTDFDLPAAFALPAVRACRLFNGAIDAIFYDVPGLRKELAQRDREVSTMQGAKLPSRIIDLDAATVPEGCLLLIDPATAPYVHRYNSVDTFLQSKHRESQDVEVVTITGVGSSALGSAAFAWDVAKALGKPVLAIVPGYGVADMVQQALGGWFGFGLHDWLETKAGIQTTLAATLPDVAGIGRGLTATVPGQPRVNEAPVFRTGSGSSDVLHALLDQRARPFRMLVGHSKGALQICNAIRSLPDSRTKRLEVVTLGCPIRREKISPGNKAHYRQSLGLLDSLGQLNMWGNWPDAWVWSWHTTNPDLPPAMNVGDAVSGAA